MNIIVFIVAGLIVISKFFDCWTTSVLIVHPDQEKNPIARNLFRRFGSQNMIWGIFGITILIVGISTTLLFAFYDSFLYKCLFILVGLFVTVVQSAVAHTNQTNKLNLITKILMRLYSRYR